MSSSEIPFFYEEVVDSTQEEAKRLIASGEVVNAAIIASRQQTAGKGTKGRVWESEPDAGLYFTYALHQLEESPESLSVNPYLTQAAALGCVKALKSLYDLDVQIKPINDLFLGGKKLGGILVESYTAGSRLQTLLTGVGINFKPVSLPDWAPYEATGLQSVLSEADLAKHSRQMMIRAVVESIALQYRNLQQKGNDWLLEELSAVYLEN